MYISVDLPEFDKSAIEEYFNCDNPKQLATFDKMFGAAAFEAIYTDTDIPNLLKGKVAKRAARELLDAFRGAKVEYEFAVGKFGAGQESIRKYERAKKEIELCKKAAWLDNLKKTMPQQVTKALAKAGVSAALTTIGRSVGGIGGALIGLLTGIAVDAVWNLAPESVKDKIKTKAGEIAQKSLTTIDTVSQKIGSSPIVQKAKAVVEKYVTPYIRTSYKEAISTIPIVRKGWKTFKAIFA
jgi:hypothetical protein